MTFSSCLTDKDSALVLDASVVISLLATGCEASIISALPMPIVVADNVVREIERGAVNGRQEFDLLSRLINDQYIRVAGLESEALQTFFDLVSGNASESLGDGEAATLSFAYEMGCPAAIDEKKATRLALGRFQSLRLVTTVDILSHDGVRTSLGHARLVDAMVRALQIARMQVHEHQFEWVAQLIGRKNVESCSSLRRLAKRYTAVSYEDN